MKKFFHRLFTQDMFRKIVAVVLGLLLYNYVHGVLSSERLISNIPVDVQADPSLIVSASRSHFARIRVRAPKDKIDSLRASDFFCLVKVREEDFVNGKCEIPLTAKNFTVPQWVKITNVMLEKGSTSTLSLTVHRKGTVKIAPVVEFSGKLSDEYSCSASLSPKTVQASGVESSLRDIEIKTMKIPLNESIKDSFDYDVPLDPPYGVTVEPSQVRVSVTVEPRYTTKAIAQVPLVVLLENSQNKREITMEPDRVNVVLKGPRSFLATCNAESIRAYVDLTGIRKSGVHTLEPQCRVLTPGVTAFSIAPAEIRVKIK